MSPVIALAAMDRAAIAEERLRIGVGTAVDILDPANPGASQSRRDVAAEIEQSVAGACSRLEEPLMAIVVAFEARDEFGSDLVVRLADHRAEYGHDVGAVCSALFHRIQRCL